MELLFLLLGIGGTWLFCYKKVKTRVQFDKETEQRNQSLYQENETLVEENDLLKSENAQLLMEHAAKAQDIHDQTQFLDDLIHKKESIEKEIVVLKESMNDLKTAKDELYASQEKLAQVHFEQALQKMADNINQSKIKYESEYQQLMEDFAFDVQNNNKILDAYFLNECPSSLVNQISHKNVEYLPEPLKRGKPLNLKIGIDFS